MISLTAMGRAVARAVRGRWRAARYFGTFVWWLAVRPALAWPARPDDAMLLRWVRRCAQDSLAALGQTITVEGGERLEGIEQAIYIANHQSWLDQPAVICASPHLLRFLGAEKYFSFPVLGGVLRRYGCVAVPKGRADDLIARVLARLEAGDSFLFYPEGTRAESDDFLAFRSGAFVAAARSGVPVVPLYLYNARRALPRLAPMRAVQPGALRVVVGEPFVVPEAFCHRAGGVDTAPYRERFIEGWTRHKRGDVR